jgi:hypothetical protein
MEEINNSEMLRVHKRFKDRVEKFINDFLKEKGIQLSTTQATKIIDDKIQKQGGLKTD